MQHLHSTTKHTNVDCTEAMKAGQGLRVADVNSYCEPSDPYWRPRCDATIYDPHHWMDTTVAGQDLSLAPLKSSFPIESALPAVLNRMSGVLHSQFQRSQPDLFKRLHPRIRAFNPEESSVRHSLEPLEFGFSMLAIVA